MWKSEMLSKAAQGRGAEGKLLPERGNEPAFSYMQMIGFKDFPKSVT